MGVCECACLNLFECVRDWAYVFVCVFVRVCAYALALEYTHAPVFICM